MSARTPVTRLGADTRLITIALTVLLVAHTKAVAAYLADSYSDGEGLLPVRLMPRLFK